MQEVKTTKLNSKSRVCGFTLIELMVVLGIFVIISSVIIANFAGLRGARNLKIAQNELVSNLRKVQSYVLSSRALDSTQPVQYYVLKFDQTTPDRYVIEALYNVNTAPARTTNVETILLPQGIKLASSTAGSAFQIDRPPIGTWDSSYDSPPITLNKCVLVAYKLPFGNAIFNRQDPNNNLYTGCYFNSFNNDDYKKILSFVSNSSTNTASNNSILTITLSTQDGKLWKTVTVNGVTGAITFSD